MPRGTRLAPRLLSMVVIVRHRSKLLALKGGRRGAVEEAEERESDNYDYAGGSSWTPKVRREPTEGSLN